MKQNYSIAQMCICTFYREGNKLKINPNYILRNCVINEEQEFAIDIESRIKFDYVKTVNGQYVMKNVDEIVKTNQMVAIFPTNLMFSESQYSEANKIIEDLKNGLEFVNSKEISNINDFMNQKKKNDRRKIKLFTKRAK